MTQVHRPIDSFETLDQQRRTALWTTGFIIACCTLLFCWLHYTNLARLWTKTNPIYGEGNWQHSMVIPLIGLYYLYWRRDDLMKAVVKPAWSGLFILILGILLFGYGIHPGKNDFVKHFGMVVSLFGLVLLLCGWGVMKVAWFPIAFLVCGLPWPELAYSWVAGPLQKLAASVSVGTLRLCGIEALNRGTKIEFLLPTGELRALNVAEACAGMRSLMTFVTLGAALAFLSSRPLWQKLFITMTAVPIAIFCNVMRVTGQALIDYRWGEEWSRDFAHQFVGLVMLIPALFLLLLVCWIVDSIFVEVAEESVSKRQGASPPVPEGAVSTNQQGRVAMATNGAAAATNGAAAPATVAAATPRTAAPAKPAAPARPAPALSKVTPPPPAGRGGMASVTPPPPSGVRRRPDGSAGNSDGRQQ